VLPARAGLLLQCPGQRCDGHHILSHLAEGDCRREMRSELCHTTMPSTCLYNNLQLKNVCFWVATQRSYSIKTRQPWNGRDPRGPWKIECLGRRTRGRNARSCHSSSPWETRGPLRLTWFADFLAVTRSGSSPGNWPFRLDIASARSTMRPNGRYAARREEQLALAGTMKAGGGLLKLNGTRRHGSLASSRDCGSSGENLLRGRSDHIPSHT
jgi:hypothetical protein